MAYSYSCTPNGDLLSPISIITQPNVPVTVRAWLRNAELHTQLLLCTSTYKLRRILYDTTRLYSYY